MRAMTVGDADLVFLGGCPRSGLTLLRMLLDAHPDMTCGPDSGVQSFALLERDLDSASGDLYTERSDLDRVARRKIFGSAAAALIGSRGRIAGKRIVAEKSPLNVLFFGDFAAMFPGGRFLHVVRDGRDVAASLLRRGWIDPRTGRLFPHCADAEAAMRYWRGLVDHGLAEEERLGPRVLRIRYENLIDEGEETLGEVCAFLGTAFDPTMMTFHKRNLELVGLELESAEGLSRPLNRSRVGAYRNEFDARTIRSLEKIGSDALARLGY